jgi:hypothetical protein
LGAQQPYEGDYLRFVPLSYPRLVKQTEANALFNLYGDPSDPAYQDRNPVNGVADSRDSLLLRLGRRFAPILIQNTAAIPIDFKVFLTGQDSFPLYVDTWNIAGAKDTLIRTETVDFMKLESAPCLDEYAQSQHAVDDCRLLDLLRAFSPEHPTDERAQTLTVGAERELFKVLYFDFPGYDERTWKEAYQDSVTRGIPERYANAVKSYVHPFIRETRHDKGPPAGYELILQYWFFYPFNDGGNNHEGDWEHVNVAIAPRSRIAQPLGAEEVRAILGAEDAFFTNGGEEELVIKRVEYYFHQEVMVLDYSRPNVYQSWENWRAEVLELPVDRAAERWFWQQIRYLAYRDSSFSLRAINTHPVGYIGADNKGTDQLFAAPGGKNRDSHGTYPFPGLYKNVGPAGASEEVSARFDHWAYFAQPAPRGGIWTPLLGPRASTHGSEQPFYLPDQRVEIVPDWERIADLVQADALARRTWSWLILPVRWGYPVATSPLAGIVAHAETGNLAVVGPAFNAGWNRAGASAGFKPYAPNKVEWFVPLGWQDGFQNELGFLNLTLPTVIMLPPFDLLWRVVALPFRALLGTNKPTFFPKESLPFRFVSGAGGASFNLMPDNFALLLLGSGQVDGSAGGLVPSPAVNADLETFAENVIGSDAQIMVFLGRRFASQNTLRHSRSVLTLSVDEQVEGQPAALTGELNFWEYAGSLRYNLATGGVQPYAKAGYGWSWYRVEDRMADGQPLEPGTSDWIGGPFNTWHFGAGIELIPVRSQPPPGRGLSIGIVLEYGLYLQGLGVDLPPGFDTGVARSVFSSAVTLSF